MVILNNEEALELINFLKLIPELPEEIADIASEIACQLGDEEEEDFEGETPEAIFKDEILSLIDESFLKAENNFGIGCGCRHKFWELWDTLRMRVENSLDYWLQEEI